MAKKRSKIVDWMQYVAARFACGAFGCLPTAINFEIADAVAELFYRSNRKRRARAFENIRLAFPDWSEERVEQVAQQSMHHMFRIFMVESIRISRIISQETWARHMKIGSVAPIMQLLAKNTPVIFITGHCGNWELLA
ncbi:MAG TPA: hypothetical protein VG711_03810, partial [Phycisphaerales bacterium]|nr:hypothetical protein [Phycisphaerales bacterium]